MATRIEEQIVRTSGNIQRRHTLGIARPLFVDVPFRFAAADGYIDDIITAVLGIRDWVDRARNIAPLAVYTLFRPVEESDPLPRSNTVSERKLCGEGTPSEIKIVLGWKVDTRLFRIFLPEEKATEWTKSIKCMIKRNTVTSDHLESLIGRLNHAAYIVPQGRYFMNRIRHLLKVCKSNGVQTIPAQVRDDMMLWVTLLQRTSNEGININSITFTSPTVTVISDACETGLGGFTSEGKAWRYKLPKNMQGCFTINLLEFIASAISIHLTITDSPGPHKILALTDSSSALGWLFKASFPAQKEMHDKVARWLALEMLNNETALYSQHIRGVHNFIADSLSRDHHLPDETLIDSFYSLLPLQTPKNFHISPLPKKITSWLASLSRLATKRTDLPAHRSESKLGALIDGAGSWQALESRMSGCRASGKISALTSCPRLLELVEEINTVRQENPFSPEKLSKPPSRMYVRPSGQIYGQTQP